MPPASELTQNRTLIAAIGDEDTITGLLLAGIGQVTNEPGREKNFFVASESVKVEDLQKIYNEFIERDDIAILLINQHLADKIRLLIDTFTKPFPAILEIPSKDHPYDPEKDSVLRRVRRLFGE
ncbi:H(+)-transporting V1 sector ATPase subunit F [Brettanomyces nanus]|uniref:V-type proton ATPase subunit F n=1 Tax=Eeniella nana TaxID=13502 RepID=A0A875RTB8_EENNA|nr:H(+)-transporting V1 sector ATPase subunit F [Brettanomyces nanus]QPG73337.1 H(+)-transporting V1 sector ATPase subunit F [Brettanomyces nanus]